MLFAKVAFESPAHLLDVYATAVSGLKYLRSRAQEVFCVRIRTVKNDSIVQAQHEIQTKLIFSTKCSV